MIVDGTHNVDRIKLSCSFFKVYHEKMALRQRTNAPSLKLSSTDSRLRKLPHHARTYGPEMAVGGDAMSPGIRGIYQGIYGEAPDSSLRSIPPTCLYHHRPCDLL